MNSARPSIQYVNGHYEIQQSGSFVCSADTWDEALDEIRSIPTNYGTAGDCRLTYIF